MTEMSETDCVICMEKVTDPYTVQCGSSTPHIICNPCELQWRLKSKVTPEGRIITCPMCRAVEKDTSTRSAASLQTELAYVYAELATKKGTSSTVSQSVRDYINILETVARVPHIQLAGLMALQPSETVPVVDISRRERIQVEMEARVVNAVVSRQAQADQRAREQEAERVRRERQAADRAARAAQARQVRREQRQADAVWCESGNIALGTCPTSRKTTRYCTFRNCLKRVCSACGRCNSH
jgi:hypothetical protein